MIRGQLERVGSLLPLRGSRESNSSPQRAVSLSAEPIATPTVDCLVVVVVVLRRSLPNFILLRVPKQNVTCEHCLGTPPGHRSRHPAQSSTFETVVTYTLSCVQCSLAIVIWGIWGNEGFWVPAFSEQLGWLGDPWSPKVPFGSPGTPSCSEGELSARPQGCLASILIHLDCA